MLKRIKDLILKSGFSLALIILLVSLPFLSIESREDTSPWYAVPEIISQITVPTFPDRDYMVTEFGAKGDSLTDCFPAFRDAINRCTKEGGGRVVVPAGKYLLKRPIEEACPASILRTHPNAKLFWDLESANHLPEIKESEF